MDLLHPTVFFGQKLSPKVAIIETKSAAVALFLLLLSFSSLFLFLLSFSFVTVILELLGLKKPAFWCLFAQMTANFVRLVFKKSARHTYVQTIIFTSEVAEKWMVSGTGNAAWSCTWPELVRLRRNSGYFDLALWNGQALSDVQSRLWQMTDIRLKLWVSQIREYCR